MKLFAKYNQFNLVTAFFILVVSSISYYLIIHHIFVQQLDRDLQVEEEEIHDYIRVNQRLPGASIYKGQEIHFQPTNGIVINRSTKSIQRFDSVANKEEMVRVLSFPVKVKSEWYNATVLKSQVETQDLLQLILLVTAGMFLLMLMMSIVLNRFLLNRLWQPFYYTLKHLRRFNPGNEQAEILPPTGLSEFSELNQSVNEMARRVSTEFESLKAFTDNASHEMQTPLAIINAKLDLLLQTSTEGQSEALQSIYNATNRLSRLNQTLLLLTKIDNEQFVGREEVNLKSLLESKFQQFEELITAAGLHIDYEMELMYVSINRELADILLNNLISNSIKHNEPGGFIRCKLNSSALTLTNSGPKLTFGAADIFKRFQKSDHSDGTGLGLAVVKQITDRYHFGLQYISTGDEHSFIVSFPGNHQNWKAGDY